MVTTFFVHYDYGSCNDGDHPHGLEEFGTEQEALAYIAHCKQSNCFAQDGYFVVIEGRRIDDERNTTQTISTTNS